MEISLISIPFTGLNGIYLDDADNNQGHKDINGTNSKQEFINGKAYILPSAMDFIKYTDRSNYEILNKIIKNMEYSSIGSVKDSIALEEIAITLEYLPEHIFDGTAYDIIDCFSSGNRTYGGVKVKFIDEEHFEVVNKAYNIFIRFFEIFIVAFVCFAFINPPFIPRIVSIIGVFIFLTGIIGLSMGKYLWEEKHRCL